MTRERVLKSLEYVKSDPYGKWGILNIEQRRFITELCNSWLILDDATNKQMEEIERLNNIINEFDKWLESESNFWKEQQEKAIKNGWLEFGGKYNTTIIYENAINKLQELKGSNNNE